MKKIILLFAATIFSFSSSAYANEKNTVDEINEILRGEISAVETYNQALQKIGTAEGSDVLKEFRADHKGAVDTLNVIVKQMGGKPATESGAWGAWASTVVGSAKILGDKTALKALKEGEQHGTKQYTAALNNPNIPENVTSIIRDNLLPKQEEHIKAIDGLIGRL